MATVVNIYDAKTHFSRLVDRVASGEEIIIAKAGKPIIKLVPVEAAEPRQPGLLKGMDFPDELFGPLSEDELDDWE